MREKASCPKTPSSRLGGGLVPQRSSQVTLREQVLTVWDQHEPSALTVPSGAANPVPGAQTLPGSPGQYKEPPLGKRSPQFKPWLLYQSGWSRRGFPNFKP